MGRQVIEFIDCGFCHKGFDVATEDLEWKHIEDIGETDEDASYHDFEKFKNQSRAYKKAMAKVCESGIGNFKYMMESSQRGHFNILLSSLKDRKQFVYGIKEYKKQRESMIICFIVLSTKYIIL